MSEDPINEPEPDTADMGSNPGAPTTLPTGPTPGLPGGPPVDDPKKPKPQK